ncbi:unnamed protein product [Prorocentrum cordatum]|uniref:Uncharacterized protein n=1 Tax=Prorocentrum cordatum TaxID=2364126 RepID=A0ABN9W5S6_9DINO|nr:unnamed protein product [Polarella glacialis]
MPATPLRRRRRSLTGRPLRRVDCSRASAYPEGCDLYSRSAIQASSIHLDRPYTTPGRVHPGPKIWCIRPPGLANSRGPRRLGPSARAAPEARCHGESPRRDGTERNTFDPEHWYQLGSSTTLLQKTWKNLRIAQGACDGEGGGGGEGGPEHDDGERAEEKEDAQWATAVQEAVPRSAMLPARRLAAVAVAALVQAKCGEAEEEAEHEEEDEGERRRRREEEDAQEATAVQEAVPGSARLPARRLAAAAVAIEEELEKELATDALAQACVDRRRRDREEEEHECKEEGGGETMGHCFLAGAA